MNELHHEKISFCIYAKNKGTDQLRNPQAEHHFVFAAKPLATSGSTAWFVSAVIRNPKDMSSRYQAC